MIPNGRTISIIRAERSLLAFSSIRPFFPAQNPHYIAVVLNEDGEGGAVDCAPVFKEIAENIVLSH